MSCALSAQHKIAELVKMAFPTGLHFEVEVTDTLIDDENNYYELKNFPDPSGFTILMQAKKYETKRGNDYLLVITLDEDMQCNRFTGQLYEIDEKKDSLISINLNSHISKTLYSDFVEEGTIVNEILPKYIDKIKTDYLGDSATTDQILDEFYSYWYEIDQSTDSLYVLLLFCDYIPDNIVRFDSNDIDILCGSKELAFVFKPKEKLFFYKR
jgi:hypothetical protein